MWCAAFAIYLSWKHILAFLYADVIFFRWSEWSRAWLLDKALCVGMILLPFLLISDRMHRVTGLLLWLGHVTLYSTLLESRSPEVGILGFILLLFALTPTNVNGWRLRSTIILLVMGQMYLVAGIMKVMDRSWLTGRGVSKMLRSQHVRSRELMEWIEKILSDPGKNAISFSIIALYCVFFAAIFDQRLFKVLNGLMMLLHFTILLFFRLEQVSLGFLLIHGLLILAPPIRFTVQQVMSIRSVVKEI